MPSRQRARESVHRRFLENEVTGPGTRLRSCAWCPVSVIYLPVDRVPRNLPVGFVVSLNLRRRHLSEGQRAWAAAQIARLQLGANQHTAIAVSTQKQAASMLNVSVDSVQRAAVVRDHGVPS